MNSRSRTFVGRSRPDVNRFGTVRTTSPKDDPGPKGKDASSRPTAIDAGFVSTSTREDEIHSAPQELSRDLDYRRLVLARETQMPEVQKLQLQLKLAKLQVSSGSFVSAESNPTACVRPARIFMNGFLNALRTHPHSHYCPNSDDLKSDLRWWCSFLPQ